MKEKYLRVLMMQSGRIEQKLSDLLEDIKNKESIDVIFCNIDTIKDANDKILMLLDAIKNEH